MHSLRFFLAGSLALLTACIDSTPVCGKGLCEDENSVVRTDASVEPLACESVQERARELLESYQHCEADEDCVTASVDARCLGVFLCADPVARSANLEELQREAATLATEAATCLDMQRGSCPIAKCVAPYSLRPTCDRTNNRCTARFDPTLKPPRSMDEPSLDAGGPLQSDAGDEHQQHDGATADSSLPPAPARDAATADAGSPPDAAAADTRFSCTKASDCEVKNVGNCCGYYPRCANVDAVFTPPDCSGGQAGVCGWPEITSCDCQANTCVSLQNGQQI